MLSCILLTSLYCEILGISTLCCVTFYIVESPSGSVQQIRRLSPFSVGKTDTLPHGRTGNTVSRMEEGLKTASTEWVMGNGMTYCVVACFSIIVKFKVRICQTLDTLLWWFEFIKFYPWKYACTLEICSYKSDITLFLNFELIELVYSGKHEAHVPWCWIRRRMAIKISFNTGFVPGLPLRSYPFRGGTYPEFC